MAHQIQLLFIRSITIKMVVYKHDLTDTTKIHKRRAPPVGALARAGRGKVPYSFLKL